MCSVMYSQICLLALFGPLMARALVPEDYTKGTINALGRSKDPFGEDDVLLKWQIPVADSSKRAAASNMNSLPSNVAEPGPLAVAMDAGLPLDWKDFARTATLGEVDLAAPGDAASALYSPKYFEGDISKPVLSGRNAIRDYQALWPNGRIPYVISRRFSERERTVLAAAVQTYHDRTCIRFEPKGNADSDFVYLYPGDGCASQVGRAGGMQYVSLGVGCLYVGIAQHELMHSTGFWHEQSRADRDSYVRIVWENIEPGMAYNFDKYTLQDIQHLNAPYDYGSVMHYGSNAFSKGYGPTIVPIGPPQNIGQRHGLSETDLTKINALYNCVPAGGQAVGPPKPAMPQPTASPIAQWSQPEPYPQPRPQPTQQPTQQPILPQPQPIFPQPGGWPEGWPNPGPPPPPGK